MPIKTDMGLQPPIKSSLKLFFSLMSPFVARVAGSMITNQSLSNWYESLNKPSINPPNWLFAPVWTALYLMMGISLYLVWSNDSKSKLRLVSIWLFFVQLGINSLWSIVFFGWMQIYSALIVILLLWIMIAALIVFFAKFNKLAAVFLVPYLLWVTFATYLNYSFWVLN